jgi:1-deoxy-D-xylulose-5-phosphate reductoisomerase
MSPRDIAILGSTGSIGQSTLDVVRAHPGAFRIHALAGHSNTVDLEKQYREFKPRYLCVVDPDAAVELQNKLSGEPVEVLAGEKDLVELAALEDVDLVLNAVVGAAGLRASLAAVKAGKWLALANKESLVAGGPLFAGICKETDARILPVDSEHSAVWQALNAGKREQIRSIILTASGGPFRELPKEKFKDITLEQALAHPTWNMGPKITIDSATLVNKGLEIIEAVVLFDVPVPKIKVVIHPQSVIHSMVEFVDSSVIAQLSNPDMRLPIAYALFWPERVESDFGRIDWTDMKDLTFETPDYERFPALKLAFEVAERGGTAPAVFNAANEIAVEAFLNKDIGFAEIVNIIRETVESVEVVDRPDIQAVLAADQQARVTAREVLERVLC